jgi:hypothetical protein
MRGVWLALLCGYKGLIIPNYGTMKSLYAMILQEKFAANGTCLVILLFEDNGADAEQSALQLESARDEHLDVSVLEAWLWDAVCAIRGATDPPKFKDFILPLVFYNRLWG